MIDTLIYGDEEEEEDHLCEQVILRTVLKLLTSPNISFQEANWIFAARKFEFVRLP